MARLAAGALHDQCAFILGPVGVPDINGNPLLAHREDGILMKHAGAHVGQLAQLLVCNGFNDLGVIHDPWVRDQHAGHIRPVLIHIRMDGLCHDGAGDIGTSPGKRLDRSVMA